MTKSLYHMLVDALSVCLPDDPEGNARLLFSIIECLPKPNRVILSFFLQVCQHLKRVCVYDCFTKERLNQTFDTSTEYYELSLLICIHSALYY